MTVQFENVAVLTTADIQSHLGGGPGLSTTGRLEFAVSRGFDVHVVSTRTVLVPSTDAWWLALIKLENLFFADDKDRYSDKGMSAGWRALFERLGIEWPMACADCSFSPEYCTEVSRVDGEPCSGGLVPAHWMDGRDMLTKLGIRTGRVVRREMKASGWTLDEWTGTNAR